MRAIRMPPTESITPKRTKRHAQDALPHLNPVRANRRRCVQRGSYLDAEGRATPTTLGTLRVVGDDEG